MHTQDRTDPDITANIDCPAGRGTIPARGREVVVVDIGGYFAPGRI